MTYSATVNWLFEQLPDYQTKGAKAYKPGLERITQVLTSIGNPHQNLRFVHIAGTNGKGSVSHILASIFIENGYQTGLFTSPHLHDFRERIKINGKLLDESFVVSFVEKNKEIWANLDASFFEITTAMAFAAFEENHCDICIIETGLGGLLDATNVITPEVSVITNIGMDHTQFLGSTLSEIASQKAGIIKHTIPVVIGELNEETLPVFQKTATEKKCEIHFAKNRPFISSDLLGTFQQKNLQTALEAIDVLKNKGWQLSNKKIESGLKKIIPNTQFKGRFQKINSNPIVIIDAAHNVDGIKTFLNEIGLLNFSKLHLVYGSSNDKNITEIFAVFPIDANFYFTTFNSKRSLKKEELELAANEKKLNGQFFNDPGNAFKTALKMASNDDLIAIFGSFYLIELFVEN